MPYKSIDDAPASWRKHKGAPLTLSQINHLARIYDAIKERGDVDNPAAVAWATWDKIYTLKDGKWVKRSDRMADEEILVLDQSNNNPMQTIYQELTVVSPHDPPKADEARSWDGDAARRRLARWASSDGSGDKDKMDWTKYARGFTYYDSEERENFGAYKLPHHDIINGRFVTVWTGVRAAMGALMGARGGVDIPANEEGRAYAHLANHYRQFQRDPPERN